MEKTPQLSEIEPNNHPALDRAMTRIAAREACMDELETNPEAYWAKIHTPTERAGYTIKSNTKEERWALSDQWFDAENRIVFEMKSEKISQDEAESKLEDVKSVIDGYQDIKIDHKEAGKLLEIISGKATPKKKVSKRRRGGNNRYGDSFKAGIPFGEQ